MIHDINNITIQKGDLVRHIYRELGPYNNVKEIEEIILIKDEPHKYFTSASISAEVITNMNRRD